ncbi:MAG TPA: hypothetical protein VD863_23825, partial [Bradyrhizobium sp.]|nr:hypothetical protein [Bradyrhizobium sp.]
GLRRDWTSAGTYCPPLSDGIAFSCPRLTGTTLRKHRWAIVRAAKAVARRVRRDRPGGLFSGLGLDVAEKLSADLY